jgi:hypothetical protein
LNSWYCRYAIQVKNILNFKDYIIRSTKNNYYDNKYNLKNKAKIKKKMDMLREGGGNKIWFC